MIGAMDNFHIGQRGLDDIQVRIDEIYVPTKRKHDLRQEVVDQLAEDIMENGLQVPINVRHDGKRYVHGAVRLFPPPRRDMAREVAASLGRALPWWLIGRFASMGVVTILTAPLLLILGIPLAFTLALMAGIFSFVPFLGPLAATVPAALITLQAEPGKLVWLLAGYGLIQLLESYIITPTIQDRAVSVPPVLLIAAQIVMGVLAGIPGVMFATPLVLTLMVIVEVVYLEHGLGEEVSHAAG